MEKRKAKTQKTEPGHRGLDFRLLSYAFDAKVAKAAKNAEYN